MSAPSWRVCATGCVGAAVLVLSVAGARRALDVPAARADIPGETAPGVVCFGHVDVAGGVVALSPTQAGRVAEVRVQEGEEVAAGAVLLRLDDRQARLRVAELQADLQAAEAHLALARELPQQHRAQVARLEAALAAVRHEAAAAGHLLQRQQKLLEAQLANAEEVAAAADRLEQLKALGRAEEARLAELQRHDPAAEVRQAEAARDAAQARLGQARQAVADCALKAPRAGTVLRVHVSPGDVIGGQPGQPALEFCPQGPRLIRAEVEQEFAARVAVGQAVRAEDDARSDSVWRGRVVRISDWYTRRRSVLQEPLQHNDVRTLECLIELEPGQPPLRIGQRLRVIIGRVGG